ncbi:DUF6191 domain-containing protein [Streptomyces sp. NPDC100445]|uniref:DUF6191 domain-containing protein n=1 Tax=Streptomyces sp. NPDC100445 TaxID=3366102 RepID=UPI0038071637
MFDAFDDLFAPGRRHTRDEQNRLALTREDVGDADPVRGPIDLASGKVRIRLPHPPPTEPDQAAPDQAGPGPTAGPDQGAAQPTAGPEPA